MGEQISNALPPKPRVSVVIPAYRRTELLRKALLSLFAQDLEKDEYEIIVVDSSPDDRNASLARELEPLAPCFLQCLTKKPEGPGPSRNVGARHARADIIAFMDSDCEASPGWLRHGLAAFRDGIGIIQGKTLPDPSAKRGVFTYYIQIEQETFLYETANIFYRREALEQSGGFGVDLTPTAETPLGGEDTEVAWAVRRLGWKTCFSPDAVVFHAVFRVGPLRWVFIPRLYGCPRLIRRFPELRRFMVCSYFFDRGQALFVLLVIGLVLGILHPLGFVLCAPYAIFRASEPTQTLRGPLRPLRVAPYFLRDVFSFLILCAGSLRYRSLLL
jgi:glycosyltransferase involved in cell wall biosynthesis